MSLIARRFIITCCALGTVGALATSCSSSQQPEVATEADNVSSTAVASSEQAAPNTIAIHDGFVKAMAADADMTAIFGTVVNHTDKEITITGFETDVEAGSYEVHEVVDGKMQQKEGGLRIAAGESAVLEPGHDHLMLMQVAEPIKAGDTISVTLKLADGTTVEIGELPVRTIASGEEHYSGDHSESASTMNH